jgi:ubiquitin carboxyl-terminal hydrolase 34
VHKLVSLDNLALYFMLTFCIRDYDGQPVNTSQQMDVDEYFNMLFDKLEKCLKNTPQERILQDCFGGKVVNQIICKEPVRVGDEVSNAHIPRCYHPR